MNPSTCHLQWWDVLVILIGMWLGAFIGFVYGYYKYGYKKDKP